MLRDKGILILGLGMQGQAVLYDLLNTSNSSNIVAVDGQAEPKLFVDSLDTARVSFQQVDVADDEQLRKLISVADIVIEALPAAYTLKIARIAAEEGSSLISSMYFLNQSLSDESTINLIKAEIAEIDQIAKDNNCLLISELGMDPGLDLILGKANIDEFDEVVKFNSYGAGFPAIEACTNPINYKFTWSVHGVMLSYLRPSNVIRDGKVKDIPAHEMFSAKSMHLVENPLIDGVVECFPNGNTVHYAEKFGIKNTVQQMGRYICRRPGHGAFWEIAVKCGFLDPNPIRFKGLDITPAEFLAAVLKSQPQFSYEKDEQDIAYIRTDVSGIINGEKKRVIYQIIDRRDLQTGYTAMQRTVGFTMSIGAQLLLADKIKKTGILDVMHVPFTLIRPELEKRGILVTREEMSWNGE
ncbi:MAG: saccharopine dehydrogenase NADP-binding domain-containing protein [Robiginitomaculum sp.]|nr:saccharopine dehydrogenase NADP-binding domain-containing protein [Robiginitomaculum sp.]